MTFVKEDMELVQVVFLGHVKEKLRFRGEQESFLPLLFKMDSHWHCLPAYLRNSFSWFMFLLPWIAGALALSSLEDTMGVIVLDAEILRGNIQVLQVPPCTVELQQYFA